MGIRERIGAAARQLLAAGTPAQPPAAKTADVIDDPTVLAQSSRGLFGDLWYSTQALVNAVTGIGTSRDPSFFNAWAVARPLRRSELYGLGRNGLSYQALAKLPNTAMREGWRVTITDPDVEDKGAISDKIAAYEKRLALPVHCARAMIRGRQYSEAMVVLGIDDGRPMSEPVDVTSIRSIKWAAVIDVRYYQPADLYQADNENFTRVRTFRITGVNGFLEDGLRSGPNSLSFTSTTLPWEGHATSGELIVHRDRVMHFPTIDYLPLLETLQDSLGAYFETMSGIRTAARESSTVVYKVADWVRKMWSENAPLAQQHMSLIDRAKSSMNAWVIDKDKESVEITSRSLGGVADLANPVMVWLCAALGIPVTQFWGVSPGGFGKGESEMLTFHQEVRAYFAWAAEPEINRVAGYILAAQDGCQLPADTQREIVLNDLTPPDEETRSQLRTEALSDIRQLVKDDIITRAEARPAVASLSDDYFRPEIDLKAEDDAPLAPVGVFTGAVQLLQALYPTGIPVEAGRELMLALASTYFTPENVGRIFPDKAAAPTPASADPLAPSAPGDIEDDETGEESLSEVALAWSQNPIPSDATEAPVLAKELSIPTVRITRAHRAGMIEGWNVLGGKPRYSREEVQRVILQGNGKLPSAIDTRDAREPETCSLVIVLRAPKDVAQWVPFKPEDPSAPHVTLLYVGKVAPPKMLAIIDAVRCVLAETSTLTIDVDGVDYFDNDERVAYTRIRKTPELQTLHARLREAVIACGVAPQHYASDFTPHLTLAYLAPNEEYAGPVPPHGWTATGAELWYDSFALPLTCAEQLRTAVDAAVEPVRDPFRTEHAARQRDPDDFIASTFRRKNITEGVDIIFGKLKSDPRGSMVPQTYRFDAEKFTPAQARQWLADNDVQHRAVEEAVPERDAFDEDLWLRAHTDLSEEAAAKRIAEAFRKYHETVNMGAAELREWAKTEWSREASVDRTPIARNLRLLETPREEWTLAHAASALRTVNFVSRMRGSEQGESVKIDGREGPSKRDISLKNWAFDPAK